MRQLVLCLVDNVVFSERLVSMLLEAFSNLNNSVWFCDSMNIPPQPLTPPRPGWGHRRFKGGPARLSLFKVLARARGPGGSGVLGAPGPAQGERELGVLRARSAAGASRGSAAGEVRCLIEFVLCFPRVVISGISTSSLRGRRGHRCGRGWKRLLALPDPWNGSRN